MTVTGYSNPLFAQLGLPRDLLMHHAAGLPPFALSSLHQSYLDAAEPAALLRGGLPMGVKSGPIPLAHLQSPALVRPAMEQICGAGYARPEATRADRSHHLDVGSGPGVADGFAGLFSPTRRGATRFEQALRSDDLLRARFEQAIGGRIVELGGGRDGRMTIERFGAAAQPFPGVATNPAAFELHQTLQSMQVSAMQRAQTFGLVAGAGTGLVTLLGTGNPFLALALGGFTGLATSLFSGGGLPFMSPIFGAGAGPFGAGPFGGVLGVGPFSFNMLSGAGVGSWNPLAAPGHINNTNPAYESAHQAQVASVLNDPSLSVEDKVMLMLALIMKKMDDDIERQMQYINALQNQQARRGKKGGGKKGGGQAAPSVDVEMQKLQRMITKRAQLFEMASNIMKKYDDTARAAIQKMNS
ncbi:MAG: hypothetical protein IT384_10095 [Deltaproteobacteria bacterium]|nr:hypothetical protein [Deltaproteobacteria bacterium]